MALSFLIMSLTTQLSEVNKIIEKLLIDRKDARTIQGAIASRGKGAYLRTPPLASGTVLGALAGAMEKYAEAASLTPTEQQAAVDKAVWVSKNNPQVFEVQFGGDIDKAANFYANEIAEAKMKDLDNIYKEDFRDLEGQITIDHEQHTQDKNEITSLLKGVKEEAKAESQDSSRYSFRIA